LILIIFTVEAINTQFKTLISYLIQGKKTRAVKTRLKSAKVDMGY
jgi:hypothetical protein